MKIRFEIEKDDIIYSVVREVNEDQIDQAAYPYIPVVHEVNAAISPVLKAVGLPEVYVM